MASLLQHIRRTRGVHGIESVNMLRKMADSLQAWQAVTTSTTLQNVGGITLTPEGTPAADHTAKWPVIRFPSGTTQGNTAGVTTVFTICRSTWLPKLEMAIVPDNTTLDVTPTLQRIWCGLFSAAPGGNNNPAASIAAFRFEPSEDTNGNWRSVTKDGTTINAVDTKVPVFGGEPVLLSVEFEGVGGVAPVACHFGINGARVTSHTANLPAIGSNNLGVWCKTTTLTAAAKRIGVSLISLSYAQGR